MHINAHLDVDLVAVETVDEVTVLIELEAPALPDAEDRPAHTLVVVLDRSGSMQGEPLTACKRAILQLVDRLHPDDRFGLVAFDDSARVVVPAAPLSRLGKDTVKRAVSRIQTGGCTDLSAGYLLGLREAERVMTDTGATVIVVSDGHANAGETSPDVLGSLAATRSGKRVTTSAVGYGLGYDEVLLAAMARGGGGNHVFARNVDDAGPALAGEVSDLLDKSVVAASLEITPDLTAVDGIRLHHDLPAIGLGDGLLVQLGDMYAGESRKVLLSLRVPSMAALGLATVARLRLCYTALPSLVAHALDLPVSVNVVPADVAAGRVPNPVVVVEKLMQEVQHNKKAAAEALRRGDHDEAVALLTSAKRSLDNHAAALPENVAAPVREESQELDRLARLAEQEPPETSLKASYESLTMTTRSKRKRIDVDDADGDS